MVPEKTRNLIVGLTVLVALVLVAYGILMLGKAPTLLAGKRPYTINLMTNNANGVGPGSKVDLNGVIVGQVNTVSLITDEKTGEFLAKLVLSIDERFNIPASSTVSVSKGVTGTTSVSISAGNVNSPMLPRDGTGTIGASATEVASMIPKDIRDNLTNVSNQLSAVARDLHVLLRYNTPEQVDAAATQPTAASQPDRPVENIATLVIRLNRTMKSLEGLLTDPQLHGQIREIVQNLQRASVQLNTVLASADTTVKNADKAFSSMGTVTASATKALDSTQVQILKVSEKLVDMLGQIEKTTRQVAEGNGTTGKLINDPRLYEGLVDLSKSLGSTVKELDFLLKKWRDEGVNFNLK